MDRSIRFRFCAPQTWPLNADQGAPMVFDVTFTEAIVVPCNMLQKKCRPLAWKHYCLKPSHHGLEVQGQALICLPPTARQVLGESCEQTL